MSNDLISRSALKILIEQSQLVNAKLSVYDVLKIIDNAPTVEERPQGKWIRITKNTANTQMWNCSECGRTVEKATVLDPDIFFPFCHCGADMREADNGRKN